MSQQLLFLCITAATEWWWPDLSTGEKRAAQQNLELTYEAEANNTEGEEEDDDGGEEEHVADMRLIEEELDYGYQVAEDEADEQCEDEEGNGGENYEDEDGDLGPEEDGVDDLDDPLGENGIAPL
ncbi:hypothetical protein WOLCODRAFT_156148 [Wolfiporia cocos MD-104 SS10]|uniref:Uncharacterized protein n=1 Tax=Wolfiporia cocos (strain MD-104) TaxID=742152 RepID=A0A2H3IZV2_WOLCO|nr:hypothetical protein WOLCODRAFT_156148 [Wolfiporia cocos MD-104 SS10]